VLDKGTILTGYRVDGVVGQGGMGVVYEATQLSLNRTVALKLLAGHLSSDVAFRERFRREGQIQAAIDHPNIITVYEAGESDHGLFLAMRLIRGPNLKDMILARELDAGRSLRILASVAEALDSAHSAGLIHRDIKPQNVLVGARDHPYLADFGLTKAPGEKSLTRTGQFVGTLDYVSPEQIQDRPASSRSDVYALAAVLYECLTGIVPYPKESEAAVLYAHIADPPPRVTDQRPDLPTGLDEVITRAMAKEPEERYESGGQMLLDAERAFTRKSRATMTPPGPIETPEESGIRESEINIPTREAEAAPSPTAEASDVAPVPEKTQPQSARVPEETQPESVSTADELAAAGPAVFDVEAPAETQPAAPGETQPAPHGTPAPMPAETQRETPAETRHGTSPDTPSVGAAEAGRSSQARPRATVADSVIGTPVPETRPGTVPEVAVPPPTAPSGIRLPRWAERTPTLVAITVGVVAVFAVVGFLLGSSGSSEKPAAADNVVSARALELAFPDSWQRAKKAAEVPGITFRDPIALEPVSDAGGNGSSLVAGKVAATGPSLLPDSFLAKLTKPPSRDDAVHLGKLEAYRYAALRPEGFDGRLTLYVSPTSNGVATVACIGRGARGEAALGSCQGIASSLELIEGEPYPLGPDEGYAGELSEVIDDLNKERATGRRSLAAAKTRPGQSKLARDLAATYGSAARRASRISTSPAAADAHAGIVRALKRVESAYDALATAARRGQKKRYSAAARRVRDGDAALERALSELEQLGYRIG
jgi:serine/threonine protein kinase